MNKSFSHPFVWGTIISVLLAQLVWGGTTTQPDIDPTTSGTIRSLKALLANNLELSSASTSVADRFCFEVSMDFEAKIIQPIRVLILRDRNRTAILVRSQTGECCTYCVNGMLVTVDHDHPGYLMRTTGNPQFIFKTGDGGFLYKCGIDQQADAPQIMVDLNALLGALISYAKTAVYDDHSKSFTVQTVRSVWKIDLSLGATSFAIRSLGYRNKDFTVKFSFLSSGSIPDSYANLLDSAAVEKRLSKLHARIVNVLPADSTPEMFAAAFSVPQDLGKDPEEGTTVSELTALLAPKVATTGPTLQH